MNSSARWFFLTLLVVVVATTGCRRRRSADSTPTAAEAAAAADGTGGSSVKTFAAPPPLPATAQPPAQESAQFYPPEPVNMYAPARPGDYQTQLDTYNRVFRKWTESASIVPNDLNHLMAIYNSPKPPQPPPGRQLVLDRKTVTVRLQ